MVKLSDAHQRILERLIERDLAGTLHGAFQDIPIEVYHHPQCPGVSSTRIKMIAERSLKHAANKKFESTPEMIFGNAFHAFMEAQSEFYARYSVGQFSEGRHYISYDDFGRIKTMADHVRNHPVAGNLIEGGTAEWTFFARDPLSGVLRKCRPDVFKGLSIIDYKTCFDASPKVFGYQAKKLLYRISAMYYLEVARDATNRDFNDFRFIAVESDGFHEVAVYQVSEHSMMKARGEIQFALNSIAQAAIGGWTGYQLNPEPLQI